MKRWCYRVGPQHHAPAVYYETWSVVGKEVHGFMEPEDGVIWAVSLPKGEYAVTKTSRGFPTSGFAPLPETEIAPDVAPLAFPHERRTDGGTFETEVGNVTCRRVADQVTCSPR